VSLDENLRQVTFFLDEIDLRTIRKGRCLTFSHKRFHNPSLITPERMKDVSSSVGETRLSWLQPCQARHTLTDEVEKRRADATTLITEGNLLMCRRLRQQWSGKGSGNTTSAGAPSTPKS
jgi:hypothetical protein